MDLINMNGTKRWRHRPKCGRVINFSVIFPRNVRFSFTLPPQPSIYQTHHTYRSKIPKADGHESTYSLRKHMLSATWSFSNTPVTTLFHPVLRMPRTM